MATSSNGSEGEEEVGQFTAEIGKTLKEGESILAPTRRPDGSLRKTVRIRAGYTPQEEVVIYQSRGALRRQWRKEMEATQEVPPGYDPAVVEAKPKSKSAKRNERKKEKRQQAKNSENNDMLPAEDLNGMPVNVESVASMMNDLSLGASTHMVIPPSNSTVCSITPEDQVQDIDKKIRALKKKIRLAEAQQQKTEGREMKPEQLEKVAKFEGWHNELKLLEDKKAELTASFS